MPALSSDSTERKLGLCGRYHRNKLQVNTRKTNGYSYADVSFSMALTCFKFKCFLYRTLCLIQADWRALITTIKVNQAQHVIDKNKQP